MSATTVTSLLPQRGLVASIIGATLFSPLRDAGGIPGLTVLPLPHHLDHRGSLTKLFHASSAAELGLECAWAEAFVSWSQPGVVRGMHFQTPPCDLAKEVACLAGSVLDVVVDLRLGSPTAGCAVEIVMAAERPVAVHVPRGCAHGFAVLGAQPAQMTYLTTAVYAPDCDGGVLWSSVPASWPKHDPVLSPRDAVFPRMECFRSPFAYAAVGQP